LIGYLEYKNRHSTLPPTPNPQSPIHNPHPHGLI